MNYFFDFEIPNRMTLEELQKEFKDYEELIQAYSQITKLEGRKAYLGAFQMISNFAHQNYRLIDNNY